MTAMLEHVNITVRNAEVTAALYARLFDWRVRWKGEAIHGGTTIHLGTDDHYIAIYQPTKQSRASDQTYYTTGGLNHIGVVVKDIDAAEARVKSEGLEPHSHSDYEPGKRFYFDDPDGIEIEVVSY